MSLASADGRRVVLVDARSNPRRTRLVVLGTRASGERKISLPGSFQPEAMSNDGRRLFLIEYLRGGYRVRLYDLARGALRPGALRPQNDDEPMRGFPGVRDRCARRPLAPDAVRQAGAPRGLRPRARPAQRGGLLRRPPRACWGSALGKWALALGLDGRTLFASNPALGLTTQVDLRTLETSPATGVRAVGRARQLDKRGRLAAR
ncbi:MAG: hypothetical protein ACXWYS_04640 [Gaiellaceae bacterium]